MWKNDRAKLLFALLVGWTFIIGFIIFCPKETHPEYKDCCTEVDDEFKSIQVDQKGLELEQKPNIADWTLSIPSIGLFEEMEEVKANGREIPVPDYKPGYFIENSQNIFIVGHNDTVFKRLKEIPETIYIYQDNQPIEHKLAKSESAKVENIKMRDLLNYNGIVIMTCNGEYVNGHYTERLILYYK